MKRRTFIASAGAGIGAAYGLGPIAASAQPATLLADDLNRITHTIHAHFGGGFQVNSARYGAGKTICVIENRGNIMQVASQRDGTWVVERATDM